MDARCLVVRVTATVLAGLHALALFVMGAQLPPDDIVFGDLGPMLVTGALAIAILAFMSWYRPVPGGTALMIVGGLGAVIGLSMTVAAGLVLGGPSFVAGFLFVGTRLEPVDVPDERAST
jgi:hypothetical protein